MSLTSLFSKELTLDDRNTEICCGNFDRAGLANVLFPENNVIQYLHMQRRHEDKVTITVIYTTCDSILVEDLDERKRCENIERRRDKMIVRNFVGFMLNSKY